MRWEQRKPSRQTEIGLRNTGQAERLKFCRHMQTGKRTRPETATEPGRTE